MNGIYKIPKTNEFYIPIPKNACTSLKRVIFRRRYGFWYPRTSKRYYGIKFPAIIHTLYPSCPPDEFKAESTLNVVLRSPQERLLSILNNRVLFHNDLNLKSLPTTDDELINLLLQIDKDWDVYISQYKQFGHHSTQQYRYIEKNLNQLKIWTLADLKSQNIFNVMPQCTLEIPNSQNSTGKLKFSSSHIMSEPIPNIWRYYTRDIEMWENYNRD